MSNQLSSLNSVTKPAHKALHWEKLSTLADSNPRLQGLQKYPYRADQQVKYLYLEAEVEFLLQELQTIKQQRLAAASASGDS